MKWYIVYREGWNEANQSPEHGLPQKMAVARVQANSPEEACKLAAPNVTLEANQRLTAEPAEVVDAKENQINLRTEAVPVES